MAHDGWRWQGRQYHQWFGHGTKPRDGSDDVGTREERIRNLGYTAVASIPASKRHHRSVIFDATARDQLTKAMTAWTAAADLPSAEFAKRFFNASPEGPGAAEFQRAALMTRDARDLEDVHAANDALAAGMLAVGLDNWPNFLAMAAERAAAASPLQLASSRRRTPYYGPNTIFNPGSPANEDAVRALEEVIEATKRRLRELTQGSNDAPTPPREMTDPLENKPPHDAKDPDGAKAPGKPGAAEEFEDPKGGEQWVKNPNGSGYGWLHKDGTVWVPSGQGGSVHGGPHWDAQDPKTEQHTPVYPGGHRRPTS